MSRVFAPVALVAAALVFTTAGTATPRPATLRADLAEWSVVPSAGVVRAGNVRIVARNLGFRAHELILVRTASFAARLPLEGSRAVATPVARRILVSPGQSRALVVHLAPGSYLLLDNLPWAYWHGASAAITVR